jgi:two-component system, chemotaxis family, chemotaxis protein CheY
MNVLVVDDSEVMRGMLIKALKNGGADLKMIHYASNGVEGLQTLREKPVDLVFVDLGMPVMNGETFLRSVRGEPAISGTPVVVVSSGGSASSAENLQHLGVYYVKKPFSVQSIRAAVASAMGGSL